MNKKNRPDCALTPEQENIYYEEQAYRMGEHTISAYFDIPRLKRMDAFVHARRVVLAACDALRTTISNVDGEPRQLVSEGEPPALGVVDYSDREHPLADAQVAMEELNRQPMFVDDACLFRDVLIRVAETRCLYYIKAHHIVVDGWGISQYVKHLAEVYEAARLHERDCPERLEVPTFAQYAVARSSSGDSQRRRESRTFWLAEYATLPDPLFPPRYQELVARDARVTGKASLTVSADKYERIKSLAAAHHTSVLTFFLGALYVYFSRVYGQDDVVIGIASHNRTNAAERRLVGVLVNVLALRLRHRGESLSFAELMRAIAADLRRAYRHRDLPTVHLTRALELLERGRRRLFDIGFNYQLLDFSEAIDGEPFHTHYFDRDATDTPLSINLLDYGAQQDVLLQVGYHRGYFSDWEIAEFLQSFEAMTDALLRAPDLCIRRAPLVSERQAQTQRLVWNATLRGYPEGRCIHELFERQVDRAPENVALLLDDDSLTYGQLNSRANQLAHWLVERGIRPDDRVAVALERSFGLIVAILATIKAGGAYVPLDPSYPRERLQYMIESSDPRVLITTAGALAWLGALPPNLDVVEVDSPHRPWAERPRDNIAPEAIGLTSRHLAYVAYTSGSTGRPKGAMTEHRGLCSYIDGFKAQWQLGESDRILQFSNVSFDPSVQDVFGALCSGASLVLRTDEWLTADEFCRRSLRYGITYATLPTQFWKLLCQARVALPETMRLVTVGGEALPAPLIEHWLKRYPTRPLLVNLYGTTETTITATAHIPSLEQSNMGVVGRPLANVHVHVLGRQRELLPAGAIGELYIAGIQVARGYLNAPELSREHFVDDPFSSEPNARMHKTGDLGRWLGDGTLEYAGRNDHQVKIRGFRVELGEIEAVLQACPGVGEVAVLAQDTAAQMKRLVAYYTTQPGVQVDADALETQLGARLPEYMLPAAYVRVEEFRLTPNGKVDRNALPEASEGDLRRQAYAAPQGQLERDLAQLWQALLGVERVGRHDNFFALGGNSLLAMQMIERLRQRGQRLLAKALFDHPTVTALAQALGGREGSDGVDVPGVDVPANGIPRGAERITPEMLPLVSLTTAEIDSVVSNVTGGVANVQDVYPLAPLQEGILFHHRLQREGDPFISSAAFAFTEQQQLDAFTEALQAVIARHDILRTAVVWEGLEDTVQVVWREARLPVKTLTCNSDDVAGELQARFDPAHTRMDVTKAPLMAAYQVADPRHHRLLLCLVSHHLCLDQTTLELLIAEVRAFSSGLADRLPPPLPFRSFVARARSGTDREAQTAYFRQQLGDVDEPSAPFGLMDVHGDGKRAQRCHVPVSTDLARRARAQARQHCVSAASLFHLAWGVVVRAATGRDTVVFGTVLFGRMAGGEGADRMLGMFLNTLPLRLDLGDGAVEAALQTTHRRLAELVRHEHASLALAQRCSGVKGRLPLFTSLMNYRYDGGWQDHGQDDEQTLGHPTAHRTWHGFEVVFNQGQTNYPIALSVNDHMGKGFSLDLEVDAGVSAARVAAMTLQCLARVVDALESSPTRCVHELMALPEEELRQILFDFNDTRVEYPAQRCIHELFEEQAQEHPQRVAVVYEDQQLTYAELNRKANQLAHWLVEQGVRPDGRVAIALNRRLDLIVAILASLKAGGAYVPLDPGYPPERLEHMLSDSTPVVLITTRAVRDGLARLPAGSSVIDVDSVQQPWERCAPDNLAPAALGLTARNLAYVIYTSGSTGKPKGVMVEHRSLCNLIAAQQRYWQLSVTDRVLQVANISFDYSVPDIFGALCSGAALVLRTDDWLSSPEAFWQRCRQQAISYADIPTQLWKTLCQAGLPLPPTLRIVCTGGEAVPEASLQTWFEHYESGPCLANFYGPTEATVNATVHRPKMQGARRDLIGRPLANTRVYILDNRGNPLPIGVTGELHIGGVPVARGYLNRPEQTAERFVDDPFASEAEARMYRTGDLARWLPDGTIAYVGRNDDQVKIRGFRVELGEVEACMRGVRGVEDAVVVARPSTTGELRLVAYHQGRAEPEALQAHLSTQLPDYMVPAAYVSLAQIPLTPNGKVDRKALPEVDEQAFLRGLYEAPQGHLEVGLATLWQGLLGVGEVSRHDDFFDLGGHSLLGTRLLSRIRAHFGLELSLRDLFQHPTLAALAAALAATTAPQLPPISTVSRARRLPMSHAQQRLWFLDRLEGGTSEYNLHRAFWLEGELDRTAFRRAMRTMIERHEVLRTNVVEEDGEAYQLIRNDVALPLQEVDLSTWPADDQRTELERLEIADAKAPFDLREDCLLRVQLIQLSTDVHVAFLNTHHIASDGWSTDVLLEELSVLYNAYRRGESSPLQPLSVQYADYACWQRDWLTSDVMDEPMSYWREALRALPTVHHLPLDKRRPAVQTFEGAIHTRALDDELGALLQALARHHGATLFMILQTAFAVLLARYSGQTDIVMGTPVAGRMHEDLEPLIGFFVNSLVIRSDLSGNPAFTALLQRNRQRILEAFNHQHLPFEALVSALNPERTLSHAPLFQILFALESQPCAALDFEGVSARPLQPLHHAVRFDLELYVAVEGNRLQLTWISNNALFESASIARLADNFAVLLEGIAGAPGQTIEQLPLLTPSEEQTVLHVWSTPESILADTEATAETLSALVLRQVAVHGSKAAVKTSRKVLTYDELDRRSHALACQLLAGGAEPNRLVAVVMEKGWQQVVALLGVLRAGAAYLPVEASLPPARIALLLEAGRVAQVVTTRDVAARLPPRVTRVLVDDPATSTPSLEAQRVDACSPTDLAYVIFTSGSTGQPKGVMIDHRGAINTIRDINHRFGITDADSMFGLSHFSFDLSVYDIFGVLGAGGTLVLPEPDEYRVPGAWLRYLERERITLWNTVPALMEMLVAYGPSHGASLELRLVLMSGDKISTELPEKIRKLIPNAQLVSLGGATEASIWSIYHPISRTPSWWRSIPYGKPLSNQEFYVLMPDLSPAPIGVVGELYIGGQGLALGYWGNEEETRRRFIHHPGLAKRLYRTGDLGRWLTDGEIEFLGRADGQVKLQGFRVELGEIESAILEDDRVREALVVAVQSGDAQTKRLLAYVVPAMAHGGHDEGPDLHRDRALASSLTQQLVRSLPSYMVPGAFIFIESVPLTHNGKVDYRALPPPQGVEGRKAAPVAARNDLERQLCSLWQDLLKVDHVGIEDNFFELGGSSLAAVNFVSRARKHLGGREISLFDFYLHPTVSTAARLVSISKDQASSYVRRLTSGNSNGKLSLICVPYGGASGVIYKALGDALSGVSDGYATYEVNVPTGGGAGLARSQPESLAEVAAICVREVLAHVEGRVAVYGHCIGSLLGLEITRGLEKAGRAVEFLMAGASLRQARLLKYLPLSDPWFGVSDQRIVRVLRSWGGIDDSLSPEATHALVRKFRREAKMAFQYEKSLVPEKVEAPIYCLYSQQDPLTRRFERRYADWRAFSADVHLKVLDEGNHYFIQTHAARVARIIEEVGAQRAGREAARMLPALLEERNPS